MRIAIRLALLTAYVAVCAVVVNSCAPANAATITTAEALALPDGWQIGAPTVLDYIRTGNCGAWGCAPHARSGRTANDQFMPGGGTFLNTNGVSGGRLRLDLGSRTTETWLAIVDANDQRPTRGFTLGVNGHRALTVTDREPSGTTHLVHVTFAEAARRYVWINWVQPATKRLSGDIVAIGVGRRQCRR